MKTHGRISWYLNLLSLFLVAVFWLLFAPTQLGGQMTYVIVDGNSMEPRFHYGDLVIVRRQPAYQVGDAVTYQNGEMGRLVFHRIVSISFDRFILKGDHNTWLDSYQPSQAEIIGRLWIHVPKTGKTIEWVRSPIKLALTVSLLGGILMAGTILQPKQRRKGKTNPVVNFGGVLEGALYLLGFLALAFLGLSIFSFTRPLTHPTENVQYQQEGFFFYSATGTPGVYDTDMVRSGEPVFPKLTCFLNVGFAYNVPGGQLQNISGSYQLYARVLDEQSGWQRTILLNPETAFTGPSYFTVAPIDLCQVESLVALVEKETGLHSGTYTMEVVSHAAITANVAGMEIKDSFDPILTFKFDEVHFYLAANSAEEDPLRFTKQGMAGSSGMQANTLPLLGWEPAVQTIRMIALLGFGFSLVSLLVVGWYIYNTARQSEEALIHLKYGGLLVDIYERSLDPASPVIDVTSIDDLAKLAERQNTMILHMTLNFLHYYLVQSNGATYRYVISVGKNRSTEIEPAQRKALNYLVSTDENDIPESISTRQEIFGYMINNNEKDFLNAEPDRDEILGYVLNTDKNMSSKPEPGRKEILRKITL